jgi:hypothetical protein
MADLNARIKPKKSSTAGEVPQAADLEVSEIAVNTADGKLFVKHTDDSIKEISGGTDITTESIDALSDVDTSTTAPTDGQVLTWVNANSKWEPADAASGGATSIDDLSDVETEGVPTLTLATKVPYPVGADGNYSAIYSVALGGDLIGYYNAGSDLAFFQTLQVGDNVKVTFGSGEVLTTTVKYADQLNGSTENIVTLNGSNLDGVTVSGSMTFEKLDETFAPTDGQVLTWVDANNRWESVDAASGGGATVLNDLTDVTTEGVPTLTLATKVPYPVGADGNYSATYSSGLGGDLIGYYNAGSDLAFFQTLQVGDNVKVTFGSGEVLTTTVKIADQLNGSTENIVTLNGSSLSGVTVSGSMTFEKLDEAFGPADGQVLTWVNANGQWETGDYISRATLQAEVAASTDFADFKTRIAAL